MRLFGKRHSPALSTGIRANNRKQIEPSTRRPLTMLWLRRVFRLPADESNIGLVLIFCVISMSFMSIALVWQAEIIANQREAIQWLERLKFFLFSPPFFLITTRLLGLFLPGEKQPLLLRTPP